MTALVSYPADAPTVAIRRPTFAEELFVLGRGRHARHTQTHRVARTALLLGALPMAVAVAGIVVAMVVAVFPGLLMIGVGR